MITRRRIYEILEKGQAGDRQSLSCDIFLTVLIVVNLVAVCLETVDSLFAAYKPIFVTIELFSVSIFRLNMDCGFGRARLPQMSMVKLPPASDLVIFSVLLE